MTGTVSNGHVLDFKGIYTFKTSEVVAILLRIGVALMMRVNSTFFTEKVSGCLCIELIDG